MTKKTAIIILICFAILSSIITRIIHYPREHKNILSENQQNGVYNDTEPPLLELKENKLMVYQYEILNYRAFILSATDNVDGNMVDKVKYSKIDTSSVGTKIIEYSVQDSAGNITKKELEITIHPELPQEGL